MDVAGVQAITTAAAPVVMVSAAGLLFIGIQTKNLHLSDRVRTLLAEYRTLSSSPAHAARRQQIEVQLALFSRRIRLSQRSLESLYLAILCFVLTALLLAIVGWVGERMTVLAVGPIFVVGVALVVLSLALEFREMRLGLQTIDLELKGAGDGGATAG